MYEITSALFLIASLLIAGTMDCREAQDQEDFYCDMVSEGSWPDYDKSINCEEDNEH